MQDECRVWQMQANALVNLTNTMPICTREEKDEAIPVVEKLVKSLM